MADWYEEMLAWLASPEPPNPIEIGDGWQAARERIARAELAKRGRTVTPEAIAATIASWPAVSPQAEAARTARVTPLTAEELARLDARARAEPPPPLGTPEPPWNRGATTDEIFAFGLSECTCGCCPADNRPDGSSIPLMADEEIRRLLAIARQRLASARTRWLEGYADQLLNEFRRRHGTS